MAEGTDHVGRQRVSCRFLNRVKECGIMKKIGLFVTLSLVVVFADDLLADRLYWGDGDWGNVNYIKSCNLDGSDITTIRELDTGYYGALDVDVHEADLTIYWASAWGIIEKSNLDGTGYERVVAVLNAWTDNIFVHEANSKIYFTNTNVTDAICSVDLDGSNYSEIINEHVLCFDIDPAHGKMYYVTLYKYMPPYGNQAGRIWQSNIDGTDSSIIFEYSVNEWPEQISLNLTEQKIYWKTTRGKFQRADFDGSNAEVIFTPPDFYCTGLAIDETSEKMYWIDGTSKKIQRANLDGTGMEDIVTALGNNPYGIDILVESEGRDQIVFDNTQRPITTTIATGTIGDTITLGGTERFITSFTVGIRPSSSDPDQCDDYLLRLYLPNGAEDSPGTLIWQSPILADVPICDGSPEQITFDVPNVRVPDTLIWILTHSYSGAGIAFPWADGFDVGSSPDYGWGYSGRREPSYGRSCDYVARVHAGPNPDAILLATVRDASWSGIGATVHSQNFALYAAGLDDLRGIEVFQLAQHDEYRFIHLPATRYPEITELLTNGLSDAFDVVANSGGWRGQEESIFTKPPGISRTFPDFHEYQITEYVLVPNNIEIDHDTPGWTYFDWDVTWEIWGRPLDDPACLYQLAGDADHNCIVNLVDLAQMARSWLVDCHAAPDDPACEE